jgi:two-component system response regulator YesN
LVVDDEPFVRVSLASLRDWDEEGYEFRHEAANGREAFAVLADSPEVDLVLVDLSMPVMNGIEFLRRLPDYCRDLGRQPPVCLVLSASSDFHLVREAFTLGAVDYLLKAEVDGERLLTLLDKAASGLAEDPTGVRTIVLRRHRDFLKRRLLEDLLASAPRSDTLEVLGSLGVLLEPPLTLVVHRIDDIESIQERFAEEGLGRFQDLVRRALAQVFARHGEGEILEVTPWVWVTWWSRAPEPVTEAYCRDSSSYLESYLNLRTQTQTCTVETWEALPDVWKALPTLGRIESRIVVQAKRYLREHYAEDLSLEAVGSAIGVSKNHLSWEFSRETGETFLGYLTRVRIDQAKVLLSEGRYKVLDAGEAVGYPNVEHFSRVFKKLTGVSPNKWADVAANAPR